MTTLAFVALGSALGAPARYLLDRFISSRHQRALPWGTWVVNVTGCFALGVLIGFSQQYGVDARLIAAAGTGFLGAYTTFSTFTWETMRLVEDGALLAAFTNVIVSVGIGITAAACGLLLGGVS